jgi:PPOX class probable F420-dependent enzyme
MEIPEPARAVLAGDALAHLVTLNGDGSPLVTCAWARLDGDEVVIATLGDQAKLRNIRRDPRVVLSFQTGQANAYGLAHYLVLYGTARITEGGAPELLQELARTYIGPDVIFPGMPDPPPGYITRIRIERIGGVGPWREHSQG